MKEKNKLKASNSGILLITVIILLSVITLGVAAQSDIPRITIQELKKMMDEEVELVIIDVQPKAIYDQGHIKGAVSIPWKSQLSVEDVWSLSSVIPIVTYCDCGVGESDSADIAGQLIRMGYSDVKVLKHPAIQGWKEAGYPVEKK